MEEEGSTEILSSATTVESSTGDSKRHGHTREFFLMRRPPPIPPQHPVVNPDDETPSEIFDDDLAPAGETAEDKNAW